MLLQGRVWCVGGAFSAPEVVAGGVSVSKRVFSCTKSCSPAEFGEQEEDFLHKKNCREEDFPPDS